jgi:DNA-binding CsgD family transcriptional regulator
LEALTGQERTIGELAAVGMTNSEIATRTLLTNRSVERHLASVYRKLAIGGRDELAGHFAGD